MRQRAHRSCAGLFAPFRTEDPALREKNMVWHGHGMGGTSNDEQIGLNVSEVSSDSATLTSYELGDWWVGGTQRAEAKQLQGAWGKSHREAKRTLKLSHLSLQESWKEEHLRHPWPLVHRDLIWQSFVYSTFTEQLLCAVLCFSKLLAPSVTPTAPSRGTDTTCTWYMCMKS